MALTLETDGAVRLYRAALSVLEQLRGITGALPQERAGIRLRNVGELKALFDPTGHLGSLTAAVLGADTRPVRAILLDKTPETNWSLGWHQDRTIVVLKRIETAGFGPWTVKAGMVHVEPPADLISRMLTMRVHLDDVPEANAPLLIAPGSHRLGRIAVHDVDHVVSCCGIATCLARAGDVWLYATPILHASAAASGNTHRRVLQVDFAAEDLPGCLEWEGI